MATITGTIGNDILNSTGADTLIGLAGDDSYHLASYTDKVTEAVNSGVDKIFFNSNFSIGTTKAYTVPVNVENLELSDWDLSGNATFSSSNRFVISGTAANNQITTGDNDGSKIRVLGLAGNDTITGGAGDDYFDGGTGSDILNGGNGNNILFGGADHEIDSLIGGSGVDTYILEDLKDTITDASNNNKIVLDSGFSDIGLNLTTTYKNDGITEINASSVTSTIKALTLIGNATKATTITGGSGNDTITGGMMLDTLTGGSGNDILNGGNDNLADILTGGLGNDTYIIRDLNDNIQEFANGGNDTLKLDVSSNLSSLNLAPYANIENIDASALSKSITLVGNASTNVLTGGSASDVIYGEGYDTLVGGKGSDTYYVNNYYTKITEQANEGYDKVILGSNYNAASYALGSNVEFLDANAIKKNMYLSSSLTTASTIYGTSYNDILVGSYLNDNLNGGAGIDAIYGLTGNDNLDGGAGADYIDGGAGNDTLYGGDDSVADTLIGGEGNDEYYLKDSKDIISDTLGGNAVRLNNLFTDSSFSLSNKNYSSSNITVLDAQRVSSSDITNNVGLTLIGNDTTTAVKTKVGTKTVTTYIGKDITIEGTNYNDFIVSYAGNDTLEGGVTYGPGLEGLGDDTFYGGAGTNTLAGGMGDDTYLIDGTDTATNIIEKADTDKINYGIDTVKLIASNGAFVGGVNLAKLNTAGKLNGLAAYSFSLAGYSNVENLDGSLITSTNLTLTGNTMNNIITGGTGNDTIDGGAGNDKLYGGEGNDSLYGGIGVNVLNGGNGDDTYQISIADEETLEGNAWKTDGTYTPTMQTTIIDSSGEDTIVLQGKASYSSDPTERFNLILPNWIENIDASAITPGLSLTINGNDLNNIITGGKGSDTINAGAGDDTIYDYEPYVDGSGNKSYLGNAIDAGEGNNTVMTGIASDIIKAGNGDNFIYDLGGNNTITVGHGNNRIYTGTGVDTITTGVGDNYIVAGDGNDIIKTGAGSNTIFGGSGNDQITTTAGDDLIYGEDGNDTINGGFGSNTLIGGLGDDTYILNDLLGDTIIESANEGSDTLKISNTSGITTVNLNNYLNIENIDGSASGDSLTLTGDSKDNILISGFGSGTTLTGGLGNDTYVINNPNDVTIVELAGLNTGIDTVKLSEGSGTASLDVSDYNNIENLDGSLSHLDLNLTGDTGNNKLTGGSGNDILDGGLGLNTLIGGNGDDTYVLNLPSDVITETVNGGNDTLKISASSSITSLNLNSYSNIENLDGSLSNKNLTLTGNAKDNILICGTGSNLLLGGLGNDTYVINNENDIVSEAVNEGNDTVALSSSSLITSLDVYNYDNIENLDGSLSSSNLTLTGDNGDNILTGGSGINTLTAGLGDDTYVINNVNDIITELANEGTDTVKLKSGSLITSLDLVNYNNFENLDGSLSNKNLTLTGDAKDNVITGGWGNDILNGLGGTNTLIGGRGNDTYIINSVNDVVMEMKDDGIDTIRLGALFKQSVSSDINTIKLDAYANVENIDGSQSASELVLIGNNEANVLICGSGKNTLTGGAGNDVYIINSSSDVIQEAAGVGAGNDTVVLSSTSAITSVNLSGYANVENVNGSLSINKLAITGDNADNILIGSSNDDILIGGAGKDTLTGGLGADTYSFSKGSGIDKITLTDATDIIKIEATTEITKDKMLFYKDKDLNLCIDFTSTTAGEDVVKIDAGHYNGATTIQLGTDSIDINSITQYLASSGPTYSGLDAAAISKLGAADEQAQYTALTAAWVPNP